MKRKAVKSTVLPEGWREVRLGEAFKLGRGRVISKKEIQDNLGNFPVYSSQTFNNGELGKINTYDLEGEYITWTTDGANAGTVFYRKGKFSCTNVCGTAESIEPDKVDCKFISYFLQDKAKRYVSYVGNPKLMNNIFGKIPISYPPFAEQKAIASVLQTWDTAIEKTEALIAAKEKQFKWLLKRLIGDQQNNPEWRKVYLGEVCSIDKKTLSSKTPDDYCFDYISLSDVDRGKLLQMQKYKYSDAPSRARRMVTKGDVLLATVRPNLQGFYVFRNETDNCIVSTGFAVLSPQKNRLNPLYLYQTLFSHYMLATYYAFNVGSNYPAINSSDISKFKITIPPLPEQKRIACILDAAQQETGLLKRLAEQYRVQKRGLMQKLLTGVWKVSS